MPKFGKASKTKLATCDERLQRLFNEVIKHYDCTVVWGHRGKADQELAVKNGHSKVHWPYGKHNSLPSRAVDVMPYPLNWSDDPKNVEEITLFAGFVLGTAKQLGINIRWGHDWNNDLRPDVKGFVDRPHFELID